MMKTIGKKEDKLMGKSELFDLSGKVSLVTGAGSGLGRVFCEGLAENGCDVICADINEDWAKETEEIVAKQGVNTLAVKADISNQEDVKRMFEKAMERFGKLDVLFNNAGISTKVHKIHEMPLKDWSRLIDVNLTGTFICMQEALKIMVKQKGGNIINTSSVAGVVAIYPDLLTIGNYVAAKHGIIGLTKQGAVEYGGDGIRVNCIAPGWHLGTRLVEASERITSEEEGARLVQKICEVTPLGRTGDPNEIKGLAVYLASDASSFVTGSVFVQDGGWSAW
ncbi:putative Levodione reductase [delta proteobacterium NaphS2]|nr:putative Levodione reductase [delta proteobacterium NaphS2]EFK09264.1 putative Levodione reductase [delta proteobacterium NaphS2]